MASVFDKYQPIGREINGEMYYYNKSGDLVKEERQKQNSVEQSFIEAKDLDVGGAKSITLMSPVFLLLTLLILTSIALLFVGVIKKNKAALIASLIVFLIFLGFLLFLTLSS